MAKLDPDSTIADVARTLDDAQDYVRRALGNLYAEVSKQPQSVITIGVTGKGVFPNYKIDVPHDDFGDMGVTQPARVFNGRTHRVLVDPDKVRGESWSRKSMNLEELKALLGELRKPKR
jgi:hypothetical protein